MCHLHIYGFIVHDMFLQNVRDCLPSNTLSYPKIQNPGLFHHDTLKKHTMDLIQQPVRCVCTISRCFKNQKLQHSIQCSVNCIVFMFFVEVGVSDIRETSFTVCGEKEHQPLQQARPFQCSNTPYHRWVNDWFSSVAWEFFVRSGVLRVQGIHHWGRMIWKQALFNASDINLV
jgi:hypothetical protein